MKIKQRTYIVPVFVLFLFSGATSLAYEVVWTRMLIRSFGATSLAVSTVLAAYMAGMALGSYVFGRLIDRRGNPILIYGLLTLGIGVFALIFSLLVTALTPLYRSIYPHLQGSFYSLSLIRFALSFSILLIPTTLMGGTLPILSRYVARSLSSLTLRVGWLYSINTFGAVLGTFGTGFLLLPSLGMRTTTHVATAANVTIFLISLLISRSGGIGSPGRARAAAQRQRAPAEEIAQPPGPEDNRKREWATRRNERVVLLAFLFTGLAALSAEVVWFRVLTLVVGTTTYAFTTMLTTFLLGLALGSAVFARIAQRSSRPGRLFALLILAVGFVVFASTVAFGRLPVLYMELYESTAKMWSNLISLQFLLSLGLMIVPTFLMGGIFPLVARIYATDLSRVGVRVGTAYAFNTVGSICGSFIGSFLLLRVLGVEHGMIAVSLIYLAVGLVLFLTVAEKMRLRLRLAGSAAVALVVVMMMAFSPGWDQKLMTSAVYVYAPVYKTREGLMGALEGRQVLFYDEGPGATVSVEKDQNILGIRIDGKTDASSGSDMITQVLLSHLPLLSHPAPDTVLIIGLGAGVTLGSAEIYDIEYLECVELLENVIEAAHFFGGITYDCMSDPRLKMIVGDGRNHLVLTEQQYDVIISQPTNPWISGVGDLFTVEFFSQARQRLKPGGIMCAWFHTYHMGESELRSTLRTFISVFPHARLWFCDESDIILTGSLEPVDVDTEFAARMNRPRVRKDLDRVSIDEPTDILSALLLDDTELRAFAQAGGDIHTDDNMMLEYQAGRRIAEATHIIHLSNFYEALRPRSYPALDQATNDAIARQTNARKLTMKASIERLAGRPAGALALYDRAYATAPNDQYVVSKYADIHLSRGDVLLADGNLDAAEPEYEKALADPRLTDAWIAYHGLGYINLNRGSLEHAHAYLTRSLELFRDNPDGHFNLAQVQIGLGDTLGAIESYERAWTLDPTDPDIVNNLAWFYAATGKHLDRALELAASAAATAGGAGDYDTLGWVYFKMGDMAGARAALEKALEIDPQSVESLYHLAHVHMVKGERARAGELLTTLMRLDNGKIGAKAGEMLNEIKKEGY
jgi:spermidine synthase